MLCGKDVRRLATDLNQLIPTDALITATQPCHGVSLKILEWGCGEHQVSERIIAFLRAENARYAFYWRRGVCVNRGLASSSS